MRIFWSALITLAVVLLVEMGAVLGIAASGAVPVAATTKDAAFTDWFLRTTRGRAVEHAAARIPVPGNLADPARVRAGAKAYVTTCEACHGKPGGTLTELAAGMNPRPPQFARRDHPADDEELREWFWVADHGLRMTGMPAFGQTRSDDDVWSMIAFVARLPTMSAAEYAAYAQSVGGSAPGND